MNKHFIYFVILLLPFIYCACSSSSTVKDDNLKNELHVNAPLKTDSTYIEEPLADKNSQEIEEKSEYELNTYYIIQIGAFNNNENAQAFSERSGKILKKDISITKGKSDLYIVQIDQIFKTKKEAQDYRTLIKARHGFKDAWIVAVQK